MTPRCSPSKQVTVAVSIWGPRNEVRPHRVCKEGGRKRRGSGCRSLGGSQCLRRRLLAEPLLRDAARHRALDAIIALELARTMRHHCVASRRNEGASTGGQWTPRFIADGDDCILTIFRHDAVERRVVQRVARLRAGADDQLLCTAAPAAPPQEYKSLLLLSQCESWRARRRAGGCRKEGSQGSARRERGLGWRMCGMAGEH